MPIGLGQMLGVDNSAWVSVRACDDFADLRRKLTESSHYWWPEIGPMRDTRSFAFAQRMGRLGPVTILDSDFHDDVWVNGGELRPHYHVTLPAPTSSAEMDRRFSGVAAPGCFMVYRPEGEQVDPRYVGRRVSLMIDRHAVEGALADALGRTVHSQVDVQPFLPNTVGAAPSWITMVSLLAEHMFRPGSVLHQPMVGTPFADSVVRGFLLAADHSYRAILEGEAVNAPPRAVGSAIDVIEAEPHRPWTVSALAACSYVSVRSLQQGFRAHVGTTPMAYLREVRLRRAHEDLLESDPSVATVASIALDWGFTNMGRFAAAYTARYNELPAATLRRRSSRRTQSTVRRTR